MQSARYDTVSVKVEAGKEGAKKGEIYEFTLSASKLAFDGFMSVYVQDEEKEESNSLLGKLEKGMSLKLGKLKNSQHFTQPPAHYTEASLVKALEEQGIGRPSTYAPTITTIIARRYVAKENKNLYVTELGEVVNRIMKENFPRSWICSLRPTWSTFWTGWETGPWSGRPWCGISIRIWTRR